MQLSPFALLDWALPKAPFGASSSARIAFLKAQPFAHRGLHGRGPNRNPNGDDVIENSRAAFAAAIAAGSGVELDVQMSTDGVPFVFHDDDLGRLTERQGSLSSLNSAEIAGIKLKNAQETVPALFEILMLISGRVPVLIEIKAQGPRVAPICLAVRRALEGYQGDVAVMSFNPLVSHWFAEHAARMVHGLVMTAPRAETRFARLKAEGMARLSLHRARPDFIAYDIRHLPAPLTAALRQRGVPVLTWTVRSADEERLALVHADEMIYEKP